MSPEIAAVQLALDFTRPMDDPLPPGFKRGSLPGTVTPLEGVHAGTQMTRTSALFAALVMAGRQ